jgi:rSAM/selenodomain-associated transferase 1
MPPPRIDIAVLARAPIPGLAKTRLIPSIGAHAAAVLQERLTERAIQTAVAACLGAVTLWCTPDMSHGSFRALQARYAVALMRQPDGDLGARMLGAMQNGPTLTIGTDCPALSPVHLQHAARAPDECDAIIIPAEDGGYVLIGTHVPQPGLFENIAWGSTDVAAQTRARAAKLGLLLRELAPLWDVDTEDDLARMEREYPELKL